jgi:E3 SUMO-protein ligase PIAS1
VMLVEVTTVEQLVDKLKKGKFRDHEDIVAQSNAFSQRSSHLLKDAFYSDKNLK